MNTKTQVCLKSLAVLIFCASPLLAQSLPGFVLGERSLQVGIPDWDSSGVARNQYVRGLDASVPYDLTVRLVIEGTAFGAFNGDYYAYLRHETPEGLESKIAVLLNRVGRTASSPSGYGDSGFAVSFSDAASWDINRYQVALGGGVDSAVVGTWQPDGRRVAPMVSFDTSPRTALLEPLGRIDPNGAWTLFVADLEAGGTGKLVEWEVRGTPRAIVPEPGSWALLLLGGALMAITWSRRRPEER
jgi:hypothetical protein